MSELHYVIRKSTLSGTIQAPPSKSMTHRLAICAGLAKGKSMLGNPLFSDDISATLDALLAFGASVGFSKNSIRVSGGLSGGSGVIDCRESGTTLRLLLPVACAIGGQWEFRGTGRLPQRKIKELVDALLQNGAAIDSDCLPLKVSGGLKSGEFSIRGDISSQFISGLLLALPLLDGTSKIKLRSKLESKPYIRLTLDVIRAAGITVQASDDLSEFVVPGNQEYRPLNVAVGGDYSSASFLMAAGILGGDITISGLAEKSSQGDARLVDIFRQMGADIGFSKDLLIAKKSQLKAVDIDAGDIPDSVPILAAVATCAKGKTRITNAGRLRDKESDRLKMTCSWLSKMGASIKETDDGLEIIGPSPLHGAVINPAGDHRIAMAASIAALNESGRTEIMNPECVAKSYPGFFQDIESLGADIVPATNGFGERVRFSAYGSSHGKKIGIRMFGIPSGIKVDESFIKGQLDRRKSAGGLGTARKEEDVPRIISGIENGQTNGREIVIELDNKDVRARDYEPSLARPGHADYTAWKKYKGILDMRGGSFFSGRMTACLVIAGAIAKSMLRGVRIMAFTRSVGDIELSYDPDEAQVSRAYEFDTRCPDDETSRQMRNLINECRKEQDSVGGVVECRAYGIPAGLGEPLFSSIESVISHGLFSIPALKGVEFGLGFSLARMRGSQANDRFFMEKGEVRTMTNNCGGILGGISNGMPLVFRCAFKPTPSIGIPQKTVDLARQADSMVETNGRHDPCIAVRAPVVVESVCALSLCDLVLRCR